MSASPPTHPSRMIAQPGDPWIGVHALSEYLYCPRAAIVVLEDDEEDDFPESTIRRGDYRPLYYTERQVLARIRILRRNSLSFGILSPAMAAGAVALFFQDGVWTVILLSILFLYSAGISLVSAINFAKLSAQWVEWKRAQPLLPPANLPEPLPVDWWQLRNAGFEAIPYGELSDHHWKVVGRPWRVLRHGSLRIPVIRMRSESRELYPKYRARISAYCHLLRTCEGAESPYGIVLYRRSYEGLAIPDVPGSRKLFHDALVASRSLLQSKSDPPPPAPAACAQCPHGFPRVHRPPATQTNADHSALPVCSSQGADGRPYHSSCGDRFHWIPPHSRATELALQRQPT